MRVTFNSIRDGVDAINVADEKFAEAQWQVSSGKRMRAPSDDPAAAGRVVGHRADLGEIDAYTRAADTSSARLTALDSVLSDIVDRLTQAMTAGAGASGTTANAATRSAAADAITGVRDAIIGDVNTTFNGVHLFAGSKSDLAPYALISGVWTYQGDATALTVDIDHNRSVAVTLDGETVFKGSDTNDLLTELDALAAAVTNGDGAATANGMAALRRAFDRVTQAQSRVGADEASIDEGKRRLAALRLGTTARLSADEDANMAEAITRMNQAETTYRAALGAVATRSRESLMDYLK